MDNIAVTPRIEGIADEVAIHMPKIQRRKGFCRITQTSDRSKVSIETFRHLQLWITAEEAVAAVAAEQEDGAQSPEMGIPREGSLHKQAELLLPLSRKVFALPRLV